jgi:hypothetical protein
VLAGWFYKCRLSTFTHQLTKKKVTKKKVVIVVVNCTNLLQTNLKVSRRGRCVTKPHRIFINRFCFYRYKQTVLLTLCVVAGANRETTKTVIGATSHAGEVAVKRTTVYFYYPFRRDLHNKDFDAGLKKQLLNAKQ